MQTALMASVCACHTFVLAAIFFRTIPTYRVDLLPYSMITSKWTSSIWIVTRSIELDPLLCLLTCNRHIGGSSSIDLDI